jgi:hypothetical protein
MHVTRPHAVPARTLFLAALLMLPGVALAQTTCKHSQPRSLQLDLGGVSSVLFEVGSHELALDGAASGGRLQGKACSSHAGALDTLTLTQEKRGDQLVVRLGRDSPGPVIRLGRHYSSLVIRGTVPANLPVHVSVGSGDASLAGLASAEVTVGSGDVNARRIAGTLSGSVGSGDIVATDVGSLDLRSIGSGDVRVASVRGASRIGSVGSGDVVIGPTRGSVEIGSIGSGDAALRDIGGDVVIGSIGSGDVVARGVAGKLVLRSKGSGSVQHERVAGAVELPRKR